ncbi:MAG: hypothetical protein M1820_005389 [Bogoriella megaspora]|nr:MAG: hypothetical protein M1820_005389 [Bogoriella megaspora]
MYQFLICTALCIHLTFAFPWVADLPGIDTSILNAKTSPRAHRKRQSNNAGSLENCPVNANHPGAAPYNPDYPYSGAAFPIPGSGIGGYEVPAPGDEAHYFTPPGEDDIRGPCPGMNTAANHNFLSHDGITNMAELMDAQQNLYNLGYDLALIIAVRAIATAGDVTTTKLSIGCDATPRTSIDPTGLLGDEQGLDGHNKFEGDTSLTRTDYFFRGDDFSFNTTLWEEFVQYAQQYGGGQFNRDTITAYRSQRYDESLNTNPNFYFGPKSLLLYGAASFIYQVFPGSNHAPDLDTISTFFGAEYDDDTDTWTHVPERLPSNWTNRATAYTVPEVAGEIFDTFGSNPKPIGGNAGVGNFLAIDSIGGIVNGSLPSNETQADFVCLLYQILTENIPGEVSNEPELPLNALTFIISQINPAFANSGCPLKIA